MEPPALAAGPAAPVRAAPGARADLLLPLPRGTQPFTYHWSRAGASLDDRFTTSDDAGGVRLTVSAAQTGDSGVYTLQASNAAGSDTSKIRLEVSAEEAPTGEDPPSFLRRLQDLTVKVGSRTRFLVEIISSTECKVTWYRNERRLLEAERVALARDGNFWCADVAAVSVDDAGRWTCTAENAGGRASCSAHLNVLVPKAYKLPEFVEELRALLTEQGTVSLECKVVGVPTPVLRWFKDSREIKAGDVFALTANAEDPTSLGTYTCEAVNCMGRAYSSSKVHVVGRASREGSARPSSSGMTPEPPPIFTKELEDAHVKVCQHLTLGCHVVVPPWPRSVVWYNKEGKVEPGERYHVLEDGVGGYMLEMPSAEWADEGEWKCVATSVGGRVGISTCHVAMDVPKNYRKPRFMENLQAVLTEEGLVSFECKVVGFPTPVLSWFKDGQELKPGDVYQLTGTNSLGSYCCIARNCMGQASSSAELTVEDIQNQLNEEEKLQLFSKNQAPKFIHGLKSVEAKIDEPFRFTVKVAIPPEPSVLWYRDDQPVDESTRCHLDKEDKGLFNLDIQNLEFLDQAEWKCVAMNDFGHSVTSCFLKLIIPRHYKKPRFLENLQAILSDEGAVNLECKVIGVPQPILKWYKDGEELKPGDIHRIISGQDGTCCLGTYTCEAQNCMGIAASSASLLGFDDSMKSKTKKIEEQPLQRNLSLSTIHEERTSQMYDTPVGDITLDDKGEISFSFDGKEVSVSLYETPDLTEEEALQIVEMYADQLSENVTEHNVVELPPLRFVKETSTSGNLLMEAIIIDVSPDYFAAPEEDLRTEADVEDLSIADDNLPPQLSLDQDIEIGGEDYLEKTMALLTDDKSDFAAKLSRKKSDSQRSADDFFSLSRDQSLSEEKRDDDTHVSESELQSFASARSSAKIKSKSSKPSGEEGQESSELTKTILLKEEIDLKLSKNEPMIHLVALEQELEVPVVKPKRERRTSRSSRRSSTSSEKSISKSREELLRLKTDVEPSPKRPSMNDDEFKNTMSNISTSLTKVINDVQLIERDIILKSELMSSAATASRSLEIISSLITPLSEIQSIADAAKESIPESREVTSTIFNTIPQSLKTLQQSLTILDKCIDMESDNKTLVKKTCVSFIETCGTEVQKVLFDIKSIATKDYILAEEIVLSEIDSVACEIATVIKFSTDTIKAKNLLTEASEIKLEEPTLEIKHIRHTQKAVFELKSPLNSLIRIVESAESGNISDIAKIKYSEVIMNDMSASIQDLQTALEQIESLSVKESSSTLQKYNTEIIETVMDSVIKLRGSFELLSTDPNIEEDKNVLKQTLSSLKENLNEISHKIQVVDNNVGQFDVLQSENKLDVLQKMAQILIALENNLQRLETMPEVKSHMGIFHKNLTKVLEKVIESNDAKKYATMMEICDTVNIINSSIKNLDSDNVLPLASLYNTLKIIQTHFVEHVFESELNCSIMNNISDVLVGIAEAINKAEELSIQIDSEHIQDFSTEIIDEAKVNVILQHIDKTIAAVNTIKTIESTQELKLVLTPALENICPILEELRRNVASVRPSTVEQDDYISDISEASFAQTIATPLCELNQNIIVFNQLIVENIDCIKENTKIITAIAEPLHELYTTLEILQQDVISQYDEDLTPFEVSVNMASVVQNLQSCIVMIHEQAGVEGVDEMSTLEDISGIKTTADTLPSDCLVLPTAEETAVEQSLPLFTREIAITATAQTLQTLNEHIMVLQTPEIIEALDTLSEVSDFSSLKSVVVGLADLQTGLQGVLHPLPMEGSIDLEDFANISKLAAITEPMQEIQQSLSVLDSSNIPIYENILDLPAEKIHSVFQSISEFKNSLEQCMCSVLPAIEITNSTIEMSIKVSTLREVCEQLKEIFETSKDAPGDIPLPTEIQNLEIVVDNLIGATDVSKNIKIDQVKCITEELYLKVMEVQEDIIQFTAQSPEKISKEANLIQIANELEMNIAVLEQYDFIDLSQASDITTACKSPKIAIEIDSESLAQIHDIAENAVNVLHDSYQEIPIADLRIVEDFFKTCKNEFTIMRCLILKATSHKKIIRLLQEFASLQTMINNFTTKRLELCLSDDVNECLTNFLIHADECLRNARTSMVQVINSQSDMLIKTPVIQLESIYDLKYIMESNTNIVIANVIKTLIDAAETTKSLPNHLQNCIIEELLQPNQISTPNQEAIKLSEKIEELATIVDAQLEFLNLDESSRIILKKLATCIKKHHDYKNASGTGKALIILKCLAECVTIVHGDITAKKTAMDETTNIKVKEYSLKDVLVEMLPPLQALQAQLVNIQEQILSGAAKDSISIDMTTAESIMLTMTEFHKDIVQQIELGKTTVDDEDFSLIMEVDKKILIIQDNVKSMENIQVIQSLKEISKPLEDIEKSLQTVLSSSNYTLGQETLPKETAAQLWHYIGQYIELIEIVEEISAVIKIENINETFDIARELREGIATFENIPTNEQSGARAVQTRLAHKFQTALSALQVQVLDNAQELAPGLSADALKRIAQVTAQLQANLVAVTGVLIGVQVPAPLQEKSKAVETSQEHIVSAKKIESDVADIKESLITEKIYAEVKDAPVEKVVVTTELPEKMKEISQEDVVVEVEQLQQKSSDDTPTIVPIRSLAGTETNEILSIEDTQNIEMREVVEESPLTIYDNLETTNTTKPYSETEAKVDCQVLETSQHTVEKITKELTSSTQENLKQHISEYVSEDITEVVKELSSAMKAENLRQSVNIAKELRENITTIEIGIKEKLGSEIKNLQERQIDLTQGLQTALSVLSGQTLESLHELVPSIDIGTIEKVVTTTEHLQSDLATAHILQQEIVRLTKHELQAVEVKTKLETAQLVKEDVAETLEQVKVLTEGTEKVAVEIGHTTVEDNTKISTIETSKVLTVSTAVTEEAIAKQDSQVDERNTNTAKTKQDIAAQQTATFIEEKMDGMQTNCQQILVKNVDNASATETVEISQQVTSVEESQEELLTQEADQALQDMAVAAEATETRDEIKLLEVSEQLSTQVEASLDSFDITEEKGTCDLATADAGGVLVDYHQVVISDENAALGTKVPTFSQSTEPVTKTTTVDKVEIKSAQANNEKCAEDLAKATTELNNLVLHIDAFISDEVTEIVNEISNITNTEALRESVVVAKKLRESVLATDYSITADEASPMNENKHLEQAYLSQTLQEALSTLLIHALDSAQEITTYLSADALQKVSETISNLQEGLTTAIVFEEAEKLVEETDDVKEIIEQDSMAQLETLLQDINLKINLPSAEKTSDADDSESLKDTLNEVQTVIIKLKREYDGAANDTLNETLEDLECSVRSVQLQINEESPPELLTEACATLQLLVDNINATQQVPTLFKLEKSESILEKCSTETEETLQLLDRALKLETKESTNLTSIISNLNNIRDDLKFLRESFLVDTDTVIENGVKVVQCLDQIEGNIFSLEREVDTAVKLTADTRDSIITAIHSVYGSISNMRSTVSSVQKQYMFENYGKPSESVLHSIKNIAVISRSDSEENKVYWMRLSKSLRKVLNHFEDIKFYINLDKTARLPNDAAFTKIILEELKDNIFGILVPRAMLLDPNVSQKVNKSVTCIEKVLKSIESDLSLEVKNKIPMFKNISTEMLIATNVIKNHLEKTINVKVKLTNLGPLDIKEMKNETLGFQDLQKLAVTTEEQQAEPIAEMATDRKPISINEVPVTEICVVKQIDEPSTSNYVKDEVSEKSMKFVSEAEILIPLEKQALVCELNTSSVIDNNIETVISSTNIEEFISLDIDENQTEIVIHRTEIDKLDQPQRPKDIVGTEPDDSHNITLLPPTTEETSKIEFEEVAKVDFLSGKEEKIKDTCLQEVETECKYDKKMLHATTEKAECSTSATQVMHSEKKERFTQLVQDDNDETLRNADFKKNEDQILNQVKPHEGNIPINIEDAKTPHIYTKETHPIENIVECCMPKEDAEEKVEIGAQQEFDVGRAHNMTKLDDEQNEKIEMQESVQEKLVLMTEKPAEELVHVQDIDESERIDIEKLMAKGTLQQMEGETTEQVTKVKQNDKKQSRVIGKESAPETYPDKDVLKIAQGQQNEDQLISREGEKHEENSKINETNVSFEEKYNVEKSDLDAQSELPILEQDLIVKKSFKYITADDKICVDTNQEASAMEDNLNAEIKDEEQSKPDFKKENFENVNIVEISNNIEATKLSQAAELKQLENYNVCSGQENNDDKNIIEGIEIKPNEEDIEKVKIRQKDAEYKQETELEKDKGTHKSNEKDDLDKNNLEFSLQQKEQVKTTTKKENEAEDPQIKHEQKDTCGNRNDDENVTEVTESQPKKEEIKDLKTKQDAELEQKESSSENLSLQENNNIQHDDRANAELKQDEKEVDETMKKKAKLDKVVVEIAKQPTELQLSEEKTQYKEKIDKSELNQKQEDISRMKKEKKDGEKTILTDEVKSREYEAKNQEHKDKSKLEQETLFNEEEVRLQIETENTERDEKCLLVQKDEAAKIHKHKVEFKQKQEEEAQFKMEDEARLLQEKKDTELNQEQVCAKKDKAKKAKPVTDSVENEKNEEEIKLKEQQKEQKRAMKEKEQAELKQKEEDARPKPEKDEAELIQKQEDIASASKEEDDARVNREKEDAEKAKLNAEVQQKSDAKLQNYEMELKQKQEEEAQFKKEDEARLQSENEDAERKEASAKKKKANQVNESAEKEKKEKKEINFKQQQVEQERAMKEKEHAELKQKEEEARAKQERNEAELNQKEENIEHAKNEEDNARFKREKEDAENAKLKTEMKQIDIVANIHQHEADLKQKQEEEAQAKKEDEARLQQLKEDTERKEEEARANQEKVTMAKKVKERAEKENKEKEQIKLKQQQEEQERAIKEKEQTNLKQNENEAKKEEDDARVKREKGDAEKSKLTTEMEQQDEVAKIHKNKAELKQNQEEEAQAKKTDETRLQQEKESTERKEEEALAKREKATKVKKVKESPEKKKEEIEEILLKQQQEEQKCDLKEKEKVDLKKKEDKDRAKQEKDEAKREQKLQDIASANKEEYDAEKLKQKQEEEAQFEKKNEAHLQQENEESELKEEEARAKKEKAKKAKKVKESAEKEKKEIEQIKLKQKQEEHEPAIKEKEQADLKQKEEEARAKQEKDEAELKQKLEDIAKAKKEEDDARVTKEKEDAEKAKLKTQMEQNDEDAKIQKHEAELKQKQEEEAQFEKENEARLQKEKDDSERKEEEARAKKEKAKKVKESAEKEKKEIEQIKLKQQQEEQECAIKEKEQADFKQKEEEARAKQEKDEAELKQKLEDIAKAKKEEDDARVTKEKEDAEKAKLKTQMEQNDEDAKIQKHEAEFKQKQEEEAHFEKENEARLQKEKDDSERKEAEARAKKEKAKEAKKVKESAEKEKKEIEQIKLKQQQEDQERAIKEKEQADLKQKEEEARAKQEKDEAELKQKLEDIAKAKKEEDDARVTKEKEDAEKAKLKTQMEQNDEDAKIQKHEAELKQKQEEEAHFEKENEARLQKEKDDSERKEAEARAKKEKAKEAKKVKESAEKEKKEIEQIKLKQQQEEQERAIKEKEQADLKQKEEEAHAKQEKDEAERKQKLEDIAKAKKEEDDARVTREKEDAEKAKLKTQMEQNDEDAKIQKHEAELKQKQEEEAQLEKENEARLQQEKEYSERKEEEARAKKEKAKKAKKVKESAEKEKKEIEQIKLKQQQEEHERAIKEKEQADLKQKEEEARAKQEKDEAELKQKLEDIAKAKKEEDDARVTKEKEDAEKAKLKTQMEQNDEDAKIQKHEAELKQKQEEEAQFEKENEARLQKEKDDSERKEEARAKKEKAKKAKKVKESAEKENKEIEQIKLKQQQEEQERAIKEKEQAELKQKEEEARAKQEKDETELKQKIKDIASAKKEEDDTRLKREKEVSEKSKLKAEMEPKELCTIVQKYETECKQKQEEDAQLKKENEARLHIEIGKTEQSDEKAKKAIKIKANAEKNKNEREQINLKQQEKEEERAMKEKEQAELKQKAEEARAKQERDEAEFKQKQGDKACTETFKAKEIKNKNEETHKEMRLKKIKEDERKMELKLKKVEIDEISKKATKYTERLDNNERRDDELHIYKKDSDRQNNKENGDVNNKSRRDVSHEQHYIREYQYEPSQAGHKLEAREKPQFIDHSHRDYTMEFARPSGYRERSFDVDKTEYALPTHDHLGRNTAIYRAQTIVLDSQLRSSAPPYPDTSSSRTFEPAERCLEIRHRSKALSEARSVISEKRTALTRDSKRKPVFSTYLTDRTAVEGSRVKLTCSVLSSSDPTVTWYKNGVLLDNKLKYRTKFMDGLITLEVLNAVPSDSAEYSCTIVNANGSVSSSATLKVYPSFEASPIPPTFTRSIRDNYHLAENELVLECRIRGQPLPTITWLKDDKSISTNSRFQAYYLADGVCRLAIEHPTPEDSGKYTCKAENSVWSDQITHVVNFTGRESCLSPNIATIEKSRFNRHAMESRRPHFTNVLSDYKVVQGGTIGLQVEIRGAPTRVEWLREGCSVTEVYRNAKTFVEHELYTLALSDVTEKESGMYTCRAWNSQCHVDMNAAITVVQPNELDGKPAIIVGRPEKDILISVGEDVNISFRVQGEPRPKVVFMKGIRDITTNQRVCKMTSDDYVKFTLKRSGVSDAGTYCILARNAYGCDRAFVTVVVRQRASSDNLISDWTYPIEDSTVSIADRKYKSVPERIPGVPSVVEGGNNWISLGWPKSEPGPSAPVLAYKVESWLLGKEGGARWVELGITPLTSFDTFNLKQGEEYHFRVTPRNRYGWGESIQTSSPIGVGLAGDRPEFSESLPGQLKVLVGETANLNCSVKGKPVPEVVWMKNGHEIEDEDKRLSSSFNGFNCCLTIKDINVEDEARYSCEATNVHGRASTYARLAVVTDRSIWEADAKLKRERSADVEGDYPPQFTMRLRDRRVQATYPVRLTCQVIGSPDPGITWFKDGEDVKADSRRSHFQDEHFHTLEIAPTTLEDGGVYEAMARNSSGAVSCRCSLVVDKGIRAYVAPEFCCGLEPLYRLTDGEELRISAVVEAYPSVGVTWYRDGVRLRPSRRAIMTLDRDGQIELALAAVTSRDAGVYTCTASNEVGRASTSGKVEVSGTNVKRSLPVFISPDEPYSKEPMFIRKPRSSEAREGDTVIIACEVVGDPKPDVYWLRDFLKPDYYRDSSHFKRMGDGPEYRFEIPHAKLDYTGAYSVVARNQHGEAKAVISLQILAKDPSSSDEAHNVKYGRVEVLPRFVKELTDLLSCDGDVVQFECRLTGHPEPHLRWYHYNELIRDCPDFETSFDDGTARLKIKQVTAEDEGTYTCEAANNLGKARSSACLVVYPPGEPNTLSQRLRRPPAFLSAASTPRSTPRSTPARSVSRTPGPDTRRLCSPARTLAPSFYTYPFNKVAEEGDSVTLQCAIKGNPAPWATWDKDGVIITPSSRITIKEKDDVLRVLEIDQVTIEDVGVYRITIENEFGRQEASARIEVITQKGKFYAGVRAVSPSPRKSLTYRGRRPSTPGQD